MVVAVLAAGLVLVAHGQAKPLCLGRRGRLAPRTALVLQVARETAGGTFRVVWQERRAHITQRPQQRVRAMGPAENPNRGRKIL